MILIKIILITIIPMIVWYISLAIHEISHYLMSKICRYNFVGIQIGRLQIIKEEKIKIKIVKYSETGTSVYPPTYILNDDKKHIITESLIHGIGPFVSFLELVILVLYFYFYISQIPIIYKLSILLGVIAFNCLSFVKFDDAWSDIMVVYNLINKTCRKYMLVQLKLHTLILSDKVNNINEEDVLFLYNSNIVEFQKIAYIICKLINKDNILPS